MKKRNILFAFVFCLILTLGGFSQNFDWIISTAYYGVSRTATCDNNDNVYMAGEFTINALFGDTTITTPNNNANIFFVKLNSDGNYQWVKNIGGTLYETCFEVACDNNDDVYITGMFDGTVSFGDVELITAGLYDIFLAKYSPSGECLWAIQAGGESFFDHALTIDFDSENNVYITGCFENTATFGGTTVSSGVPSGGDPNVEWGAEIFVAKYSSDGEFVWVKHIPGTHHINRGHCIAVTSEDEIFVSGKFEGELYFENDTISSFGAFDAFHFMIDSNGNTLWANNAGSSIDDKPTPSGIAIDDYDNIYVTGFFQDEADFSGTQITSNGSWDIYLAKYNPDGNLVWIRNDGGELNERAYGIAINENKLLISGYMYGNSVYNNEITLTTNGLRDIFIACYDTDGDFYWANNHGGPGDDWAFQIANDNQDAFYITGIHNDEAIFNDTILNTSQYQNIFISKFTDTTLITRQKEVFEFQNEILVYPNPTHGVLYISQSIYNPDFIKIRVFNLSGKIVYSNESLNNNKIDLTHLKQGIYFLEFRNRDIETIEKLIIQ